MRSAGLFLLVVMFVASSGRSGAFDAPPLGIEAFVAAFPDHLAGIEDGELVFHDGARLPLVGLRRPLPVPEQFGGEPVDLTAETASESISAIDYEPIYRRMYGDCRAAGVEAHLVTVQWLRGLPDGGVTLRFSRVNGAAERLQMVSDELEALPAHLHAWLRPVGGTFACRNILFSNRMSLHGFGVAIDINPARGDYWAWANTNGRPAVPRPIPAPIIEIFERYGFVWGGRWHRFDTFHFEFRPEYALATGGRLPARLTRLPPAGGPVGAGARAGPVEAREGASADIPPILGGPRVRPGTMCWVWIRQPGPRYGRCVTPAVRLPASGGSLR